MAAVGVLPLVPATTIEPCGSSEASVAAISGAMRAATRPGRLVAPPRPDSTEARPASRPAVTASVALKREVMLLNSSSHGHLRVKHLVRAVVGHGAAPRGR